MPSLRRVGPTGWKLRYANSFRLPHSAFRIPTFLPSHLPNLFLKTIYHFNVMAVFTSPALAASWGQRAVTVLVWV